jgi:hypothetical protein
MTPSPHLSHLRFGLTSLYALHSRQHTVTTPGLHYLLPIPLKERLILLATIDGADERTIRQSLKVSKDDASLTSRRMKRAMQRVKAHLSSPHSYWPDVWTRVDLTPDEDLTNGVIFEDSQGIAWNRRYGSALESHLARLLWADVAVALIGHGVPPEVSKLSLKQRLVLYCLLVEGLTQEEIIQIMGCTEWDVDRSLRDGLRAVGGA